MPTKQITTIDDAVRQAGRRFSKIRAVDDLTFAEEKMHVQALIKRNKDLKNAMPDTIYDAMLQAASMGLSFNPTLAHCYLITRRMRKRRQGESDAEYAKVPTIAYATPSYRGLIHIPVAAGAIRFARAEVIYKDDHFVYRGPHHDVEYELKTPHTAQIEKNAVGVFAVAKTIHGDYLSEHVPRETVQRIRRMSDMPNSVMYHPDKLWTEGWKKISLRRLYKTMPNAPMAMSAALETLNTHEGLDPANLQRQEETGSPAPEALVLINDEHVNTLHSTVVESGRTAEDADRWLSRLAKTYELEKIEELPVAKFDEAMQKIQQGVKA